MPCARVFLLHALELVISRRTGVTLTGDIKVPPASRTPRCRAAVLTAHYC